MNIRRLATATLLAGALSSSAFANLITNGSFEANGGLGELAGGISYATGWTVGATADGAPSPFVFIVDATADTVGFTSVYSPPNIKVWGPGNSINNGFTGSADGGYFLGVDGDYARAPVFQTVSGLTPGAEYELVFEWAQAQFTDATGATTSGWNVQFGSENTTTGTPTLPSQGFSGWSTFSHTFTASSVSQTLTFMATGGPAGLPPFVLLDGVSLTQVPDAPGVPEPGTMAILGGGLAGLLGIRRIRARRNSAK